MKRRTLSRPKRDEIHAKTAGHCHICGGALGSKWAADHVVPHAAGGDHAVANYLPACSVCNGLRWYYTPEQIREILVLGICARAEMRRKTPLGGSIAVLVNRRKASNERRRKPP